MYECAYVLYVCGKEYAGVYVKMYICVECIHVLLVHVYPDDCVYIGWSICR